MRDGFEEHVFARRFRQAFSPGVFARRFRFVKTLHRDLNLDLGQKCRDSCPVVSRRRLKK